MTEGLQIDTGSRQLQNKIHSHIQKHWKLYAREGMLFIILGITANVIPHVIFKKVSVVCSGLMVLGGFVQLIRSLIFIRTPGLNLFIFSGLLQLSIAFYFLAEEPVKGKIMLALLLIVFLSIESAIKIALAFMIRPLIQWDGMLFSGLASILMVVVLLIKLAKHISMVIGFGNRYEHDFLWLVITPYQFESQSN